MRTILILWLIPVVLFWGWYGLSANDINFGVIFFSRGFHDHIFQIYGNVLQMPAEEVPVKLAWIFAIDTLIVFGIAALRWYKHWLPGIVGYLKQFFSVRDAAETLEERVERALDSERLVNPVSVGQVRPAE